MAGEASDANERSRTKERKNKGGGARSFGSILIDSMRVILNDSQTAIARKEFTSENVGAFVRAALPETSAARDALSARCDTARGTTVADVGASAKGVEDITPCALPEAEVYAYYVVLMHLIDVGAGEAAMACATEAVHRIKQFNRRTMDSLAARVYFYYSLAFERFGSFEDARETLLALYRTSALRLDEIGQETLVNLLLRNYLHYNLYGQAEKLRSRVTLPQSRSIQQQCRYLYYLGRIRAVQLEYSEAKECLTQAYQKAPTAAKGFRLELLKWITIVRMLLGEIPERNELTQPEMREALVPYFALVQAVRLGDLAAFQAASEAHGAVFNGDKLMNLITRLRANVIRTGLTRINTAYSKISLADVAEKLGLPSVEDAESVVAKAIRDGNVDAVIDHSAGVMFSKETTDIYSTQEPQNAFHMRIAFCLDTHNEAVKAMRYPPRDAKPETKDAAPGSRIDNDSGIDDLEDLLMDDDGDFF